MITVTILGLLFIMGENAKGRFAKSELSFQEFTSRFNPFLKFLKLKWNYPLFKSKNLNIYFAKCEIVITFLLVMLVTIYLHSQSDPPNLLQYMLYDTTAYIYPVNYY